MTVRRTIELFSSDYLSNVVFVNVTVKLGLIEATPPVVDTLILLIHLDNKDQSSQWTERSPSHPSGTNVDSYHRRDKTVLLIPISGRRA